MKSRVSLQENRTEVVSDRHKGLPALVLGNAPSASLIKGKDISNFVAFGVNQILDLVQVDYLVMLDNAAERKVRGSIRKTNTATFMSCSIERECAPLKVNAEDYNLMSQYKIFKQFITQNPILPLSHDIKEGLFYSRSSIVPAINLAFLMGCNPIGVLGVELLDNSHFYSKEGEGKVFSNKDAIIKSFKDIKFQLNRAKVLFYNLSPKTALTGMDYLSLEDFLKENDKK